MSPMSSSESITQQPSPSFSAEGALDGRRYVLRLVGEFDLAAMPKAHAGLAEALSSDWDQLLIDLSGLTFLDSSGLRFVLEAATRCEQSYRDVVLRQGPDGVHRVFELTGLSRRLRFVA